MPEIIIEFRRDPSAFTTTQFMVEVEWHLPWSMWMHWYYESIRDIGGEG